MKTTELRIGNLVDLHGQEDYKVIGLDKKFITVKYKNHETTDDGSNLLPVPLTEELLLKAGFKEDYLNDGMRLKNIIIDSQDRVHIIDSKDYGIIIARNIEYMHQLQNLYFAKTGKELEIKN